jgi:hypothetical protein
MSNKRILLLFIVVGILSIIPLAIHAALPNIISFQGQLADSSGEAVTGTKSIIFKIYNAASGGTALKTQPSNVTLDSSGLYNVELDISGVTFNGTYYLGITVGSDSEMTPRIKIVPSACAIYAGSAGSAAIATTATTATTASNATYAVAAGSVSWNNIADLPASFADGVDNASTATLSADSVGGWNIVDSTITSADILNGTIASIDISDDTIVNADINSAAAIADTKLAQITTADKVAAGAIAAGTLPSDVVASSVAINAITPSQILNDADYDILVSTAKYVSGSVDAITLGGISSSTFATDTEVAQAIANSTASLLSQGVANATYQLIFDTTSLATDTEVATATSTLLTQTTADSLYQSELGTTTWVSYDSNRLGGVVAADYTTQTDVANATTTLLSKAGGTLTGAITSSSQYLQISTNVYVIGYSSAAAYYGDGSQLTGITATTLDGKSGTYYVSTGAVDQAILGIKKINGSLSTDNARLQISSNVYVTGYSSATVYYGDGSQLTGITATTLNGKTGAYYVSTGAIDQAILGMKKINGSLSTDNARLQISSNVYVTGYSSATAYYGDGSQLTGITATTLDGKTGAYYVSTGAVDQAILGIKKINGSLSTDNSRLQISSNVYVVGYSSATAYYGDGSQLTGITATTLDGKTGAYYVSTGAVAQTILGVKKINGSLSTDNARLQISSNVYVTGYSSATAYYGNGSNLTNISADTLGGKNSTEFQLALATQTWIAADSFKLGGVSSFIIVMGNRC